jgi:amino acid adenylation domain-containing protein
MQIKYPAASEGNSAVSSDEWNQIVNEFNNTIAPYPKEKTLFGLFEEQVLKSPEAIALRKGDKTMTYDELNKQGNRLAHLLIDSGIVPEDNIGLLVTRDFEMIIGMMAILKAGGAYVPIDPEYPVDRQEYIFNQSLLKMVIADKEYPLKELIDEKKYLTIDFNKLGVFDDANPGLEIDSRQLAYTIYTSGSTGRPKGVMIEHHSVVNLVLWVNNTYNIGLNDRLLFITSMCFDLSVYDIFGMLSAGGCLVIAETKEIQNVKTLQEMLVKYDITFWDSVPTTLDYLVRDLEREQKEYRHDGLKTVFMSGDWIPVGLPGRIKEFFPQAKVISLGGATEATVWSNFFPVEQTYKEWKSIPYGKPITNNFFYILDEQLHPVPIGVMGDLYIGGVGVARGYANDPEKTRNSFIPDPFNSSFGGVMYRTGDLGRMMPDLNMEFMGRKDNQVKIQGFRVELGEIESVLNSCGLVTSAVVLAKDGADGKKMLVGYIVPKGKYEREPVIDFLKTKVPHYMVPAVWIELSELPLTSNGKIDRKALPEVDQATAVKKSYLEPATETEKVMAALWKESMGLDHISAEDNFFELGGHSLMAVRILSKFEKKTGKNLQLAVLFKYPNIRSLSDFIDNSQSESIYKSLVPIKASGNKAPIYIIHGEGLNVLNFSHLVTYMDSEQPIYGLQALGLMGDDQPLENLPDIAGHYIKEIMQHNPSGPYLLAGYSFGGYVAVEMRKQLTAMGRQVKMLMMFDTNAEKTEYKDWMILPKKVKRNLPKLLSFIKSLLSHPLALAKQQYQLFTQKRLEKTSKHDAKSFYQKIKNIKQKHLVAFRKYPMEAFDDKVYLYRADICVHYVNDYEFLGWKKFAKKGVELYHIPGDHLSMLLPPNVKEFASILQKSIDDCQ